MANDYYIVPPPREEKDPFEEYGKWAEALHGYNVGRIPEGQALEESSSARIGELLNPPDMFVDTAREAAELGAGRGVAGSPAAFGTYLRMSDDEKLKRIALGQEMLTAAMGRYPQHEPPPAEDFFMTPYEEGYLRVQNRLANIRRDELRLADRQGRKPTTFTQGMPNLPTGKLSYNDPNQPPLGDTPAPTYTPDTHGTRDPDLVSLIASLEQGYQAPSEVLFPSSVTGQGGGTNLTGDDYWNYDYQ